MKIKLKQFLSTVAMLLVATFSNPQKASAQACQPIEFESTKYLLCTVQQGAVQKGKGELRLFWQHPDGKPYQYFSRLAKALHTENRVLAFAMNAGMYLNDFSPMGLYIENGNEQRHANKQRGENLKGPVPNFYKKPNGVFYFDDKVAGILPTDEFLNEPPKVRFATQSGPMLVIRNQLHPAFIKGSTDRTRRSGVGVCEAGKIHFAISEDPVNFYDFARLFRDHLQCPNALFLDGGQGTGIYEPSLGRNDISWHGGFGPIVGLVQ